MNDSITVNVGGYNVTLDADFAADFDPTCWKPMKMKGGRYVYFAASLGWHTKPLLLHRLLCRAPNGLLVDHINGNFLDNRTTNLRLCTRGENGRNRKARHDSKSGSKGVYFRPNKSQTNPWYADIHGEKQGKRCRVHVGCFPTREAAVAAYNAAAIKYHGKFAKPSDVSCSGGTH